MLRLFSSLGALALLVALAPAARAQSADERAQTADERAVLEVVDRLFEGMRTADSAKVRSVFHPEARLISTGMREGRPAVQYAPIDGFVEAVGRAADVWDERTFDPEVRIDENLAHVWVYYTFHAGDRFSHCGYDGFQLARTEDGWKVVSIADTRRREGCDRGTGR